MEKKSSSGSNSNPSEEGELNPSEEGSSGLETKTTKNSRPEDKNAMDAKKKNPPGPQRKKGGFKKINKQLTVKSFVTEDKFSELVGDNPLVRAVPGATVLRKTHPIAATARNLARLKIMDLYRNRVIIDWFGSDSTLGILEGNREKLKPAQCMVLGYPWEEKDFERRKNTSTLEAWCKEQNILPEDSKNMVLMLVDVYACSYEKLFKRARKLGFHTIVTARMNFLDRDGTKFEGEGTYKVLDGNIMYVQKEDPNWWISHTWDQEMEFQNLTKNVPKKNKWACAQINSVSDYDLKVWQWTKAAGRRYVFEGVERPPIKEVTWTTSSGENKTAKIFSDLGHKTLLMTTGSTSATMITGRVRRVLFNAVEKKEYQLWTKPNDPNAESLSTEEFSKIFCNTLEFVVNRPEYHENALKNIAESFLQQHKQLFGGLTICWNLLFGTSYTPATMAYTMIKKVFGSFPTVLDKILVWYDYIRQLFGEDPTPKTFHGYVQTRGFEVKTNEQIYLEVKACEDNESMTRFTKPIAVKTHVAEGVQNTSIFSDEQAKIITDIYAEKEKEEVHIPAFFTFCWIKSSRLPPSSPEMMLNKNFPKKKQEYHAHCSKTTECDGETDSTRPYYARLPSLVKKEKFSCLKGSAINEAHVFMREQIKMSSVPPHEESYETFLQGTMPSFKRIRRKNAMEELDRFLVEIESMSKIEIFGKKDEMNRTDFNPAGDAVTKMRAIFNVDTLILALSHPFSKLYKHFKKILEEPILIRDWQGHVWTIYVKLSSLHAPIDLTSERNDFEMEDRRTIYLLIAGDDINIWIKGTTKTVLIGNEWSDTLGSSFDVKSCDGDINFHHICEFLKDVSIMGYKDFASILWRFYSKVNINVVPKDQKGLVAITRAVVEKLWQTYSGEPITTVKNTWNVAVVLLHSLKSFLQRKGTTFKHMHTGDNETNSFHHCIKKIVGSYGLTISGETFYGTDIDFIDFLKGWWPKTETGDYVFQRLPSSCTSFGKTRSNFIHHTPSRDMIRSMRYCMYAQYKGNKYIARNTPILGPFLAMCERVSLEPVRELNIPGIHHRLHTEGTFKNFSMEEENILDLDHYESMLSFRYPNLDAELVLEFEEFCDSITYEDFSGGVIEGFEAMTKVLLEVDYGKGSLVP